MSNIIKFKINRRNEMITMFDTLLNRLEENNKRGHKYSLSEINTITQEIISMVPYYPKAGSTPIVRIAKDFNFKTYKEVLDDNNLSGDININGDTLAKYGHKQVILVNKNDELFHQRFVVAHELGHYLFDYLGNSKYADDENIKFSDTYYKNQHETLEEKRANRFAADIMMPKELFIKQYNIARNADSNRLFAIIYLSRFFETSMESIEKRIMEVLN